jgi:hypothetical protein
MSSEKLTPADGKLLKMIIFEEDGRGQVEAQGVDTFFFEPFACRLASELLQHLAGVVPGQELTRLQQRPELLAQLPKPLEYNPAEYAGVWRQMLEINRLKTADKRRRQQLKDV